MVIKPGNSIGSVKFVADHPLSFACLFHTPMTRTCTNSSTLDHSKVTMRAAFELDVLENLCSLRQMHRHITLPPDNKILRQCKQLPQPCDTMTASIA
jgi:hypothetical protein